jgi:hypothetical protein
VTVALQMTKAPAAKPGAPVLLPEGAAVRADVTDALTGLASSDLIDRSRRHALKEQILRALLAIDEEFGLRVTEVVSPRGRLDAAA